MYAARRSGLKQEMFGYVDGGYATVLTALRRRLADIGVEVRTGTPVSRVGGENGAAQVEAGGDTLSFDAAVLTVSCPGVLRLCPTLQTGERERLGRVVYQGVLCASLLLRRPLAGYYVTNITDDVPFTAVIEMTALVDRERFGGNALVYLPRYLAQEDDGWQRSDHDIREEFLAGLERMYPHFRREDVLGFQVARAREVLALATMHYTERSMPPLETSIPNVYIANSAQIANGTLNVNETVALAERQAAALIARLAATAGEPV
ncbi:MAG: FAD-dependent oxidoreductase [Gemmatimonadales bacterium]